MPSKPTKQNKKDCKEAGKAYYHKWGNYRASALRVSYDNQYPEEFMAGFDEAENQDMGEATSSEGYGGWEGY